MKFCGETVLCNQCAVHLLSENAFGLGIWECNKSYERESKKWHLKVLSIFPFGMVE